MHFVTDYAPGSLEAIREIAKLLRLGSQWTPFFNPYTNPAHTEMVMLWAIASGWDMSIRINASGAAHVVFSCPYGPCLKHGNKDPNNGHDVSAAVDRDPEIMRAADHIVAARWKTAVCEAVRKAMRESHK